MPLRESKLGFDQDLVVPTPKRIESGVRLPLDLFPRLNSIRGAVKEETTEQRKAAAVRFIVQVCTVQCPPNRAPQAPSCNAATGHHRPPQGTGHNSPQATSRPQHSAVVPCCSNTGSPQAALHRQGVALLLPTHTPAAKCQVPTKGNRQHSCLCVPSTP